MRRTPSEVVALLPAQAAVLLMRQGPTLQQGVVESLGEIIELWEKAEVRLDPHQFEVVVESLVIYMVMVGKALQAVAMENARLKRGMT